MVSWNKWLALTLLLAGGCFGGSSTAQQQASARKRSYAPEIALPAATAPAKGAPSLRIKAARAQAPFDIRNFLVRRAPGVYRTDFYNSWILPPQELLASQLRTWLEGSGLFSRVQDARIPVATDYSVDILLSALYRDDTGETPKAVATLRLTFFRERGAGEYLFSVERTAETELSSPGQEEFAKAASSAIGKTLANLTDDIRKKQEELAK